MGAKSHGSHSERAKGMKPTRGQVYVLVRAGETNPK